MIITHETTIEEYEAWLATNPSFSDFKVAVRSTFAAIYRTIGRIGRIIKRVKNSSCLSGARVSRTVYPLLYNKNATVTRKEFRLWLRDISHELQETKMHIWRISKFDCLSDTYENRRERIAKIEQEIAMEHTLEEALEILAKK